jgi:plasmid maintenance system antidote protein VapI
MNFPGSGLHLLLPKQESRWAVKVSGNWRITFVFREDHAFNTTPALWLGLQQEYDLWHARHDTKEWRQVKAVREMASLLA